MATDTLDKVLKERFESWMRSKGIDLDGNFHLSSQNLKMRLFDFM